MQIYFIQIDDNGPIKIGKAGDPHKRRCELQVAHHRELIIRHIEVPERDAAEREKELHGQFKAHRIRGEWFRPAYEILEFIGRAPLTWEKITALDDDLKFLYEDALVAEYEKEDFGYQCPKLHRWYRGYKPRMLRLVGFGRNQPPEELEGTEAYEICYHKICDALPCPEKCKYFGAPCTHTSL